jgi:hypothetical protein
MQNCKNFDDLEALKNLIVSVQAKINTPETKAKEEAARYAYDSSIGLFERFKMIDFSERYSRASLPVREEIIKALPDRIQITPQIAFFLAADEAEYQSKLKEITLKYDVKSSEVVKGMAYDALKSVVHPAAIMSWVGRIGSATHAMFEHMINSDKAVEERNAVVGCVLGSYSIY